MTTKTSFCKQTVVTEKEVILRELLSLCKKVEMNDFNRSNKASGVHWLKQPIENLKIVITLKPHNGIYIPHFEDFGDKSNASSSLQIDSVNIQEFTFRWQEKAFSAWEVHRYSDVHHCITDTELNYNDRIKNQQIEPSKVFTYTNEDNFPTNFEFESKTRTKSSSIDNLSTCMERLNLNARLARTYQEDSSSMGHLFRSEENIIENEDRAIAMHVMLDNSDYNEDYQLLLKHEAILVSLYYNPTKHNLLLTPNLNDIQWNPYTVETSSGVRWNYQYSVGLEFEDYDEGSEELSNLIKKLSKKWQKKHKTLLHFVMPPLGKKQFYVTLEILSAKDFEMDDLYVEFFVKVPEGAITNEVDHGRTHVSRARKTDEDGFREWCFAHVIELFLETEFDIDLPPLQLFFEAISTDWWGRHRTEGYIYLPLAMDPGCYSKRLTCLRPEERDRIQGESRRFFVGGCHLVRDLSVLTGPQKQDSNFTYTKTGSLDLRWSIVRQTHVPGSHPVAPIPRPPGGSATALLKGAEAVLRQYRRARERLHQASVDVRRRRDGSGDTGVS